MQIRLSRSQKAVMLITLYFLELSES